MPLFEVDAERPVLVHPTPTTGGFGTAAQRVVDGNLDGLLGEQIFPVAQGRAPEEPHLIALDSAGLPVVIDVVSELTEETLTRALNHAGAAGHLSRAELGDRYPRGAGAFQQDVAAFYDNAPLTRAQGGQATGARLIVICQEAAEGVLDALDFLRQPGSPVAVLRLGVVKTADGRRFVDVSPLAVSREHRPVARATAQLPDNAEFAEGVAVGHALTGKIPVLSRDPRISARQEQLISEGAQAVAPEPKNEPPVMTGAVDALTDRQVAGERSVVPVDITTPRRTLLSRAERRRAQEPQPPTYRVPATSEIDTAHVPPSRGDEPRSSAIPTATRSEPLRPRTGPAMTVPPVPGPVGETPPTAGGPLGHHVGTAPELPPPSAPVGSPGRQPASRAQLREAEESAFGPGLWSSGGSRTESAPAAASLPAAPVAEPPPAAVRNPFSVMAAAYPIPPAPPTDSALATQGEPRSVEEATRPDLSGDDLGADDDPDLISLARSIGAPAALVWSRPRRGQRYEATLLPDGYIVLVDGSRFRHPDLAAIAVSGTQSADGWSVWRFGDDGPTLTDAFRAQH